MQLLFSHPALLEGIAHTRAWFFDRHVLLAKTAKHDQTIQVEAGTFFLADAAADAARRHFAQTQKPVRESAIAGVKMLAMGVSASGDPVGIRRNIGKRVGAWASLVKGHAGEQQAREQRIEANKNFKKNSQDQKAREQAQRAKKVATERAKNKRATDPSRLLSGLGLQVLGPVASGAFSTILRCKNVSCVSLNTKVDVAVKTFDGAKCSADELIGAALSRELTILRMLEEAAAAKGEIPGHPHIANLLTVLGDASRADGHVHLVLEYASGGSLKRHLETLRKVKPTGAGMAAPSGLSGMAPPLAARASAQLASALAHLHCLEIAHGDVKPANVLLAHPIGDTLALDAGGLSSLHVKLCDFGFSCVCGDAKLTHYCGTPSYLAPECANQALAKKGYKGRPVDMWALGCVAYEMLHNAPSFFAHETFQLESLIKGGKHAPMAQPVPAPARALVTSLLSIDPAKRPTAAAALEGAWLQQHEAAAGQASPSAPPQYDGGGRAGASMSPQPHEGDANATGHGAPPLSEQGREEEGSGMLGGVMRLFGGG